MKISILKISIQLLEYSKPLLQENTYLEQKQQQNGKETSALPMTLSQSNNTGARLEVFKANMKSTVF
jgi:hypothetical protein